MLNKKAATTRAPAAQILLFINGFAWMNVMTACNTPSLALHQALEDGKGLRKGTNTNGMGVGPFLYVLVSL